MRQKTMFLFALALFFVLCLSTLSHVFAEDSRAIQETQKITIHPSKTALLLLHWQNDVAKPAGKLSGPLPKRIAAAGTIENTLAVLKAAREKKMLIIYVAASLRPGYPEIGPKPGPLFAGVSKNAALVRGTWGAEIIDELKPLKDEVLVFNYSPDGFANTDLDLVLRNKGITSVVLSGLVTNWVVETTAREAASRGYFVYTLADCCNTYSDEWSNFSLKNILPMLGAVTDSKAFIEAVKRAE